MTMALAGAGEHQQNSKLVTSFQQQLDRQIPRMRVVIMVAGTRGDVQPAVALALRLQQHGHLVRVATHEAYRGFVTQAGVKDFGVLGGDPVELTKVTIECRGMLPCSFADFATIRRNYKALIFSTLEAATQPFTPQDPTPSKPDLIISTPITHGVPHVAEALRVPLHVMSAVPWAPSKELGHPWARGWDLSWSELARRGIEWLLPAAPATLCTPAQAATPVANQPHIPHHQTTDDTNQEGEVFSSQACIGGSCSPIPELVSKTGQVHRDAVVLSRVLEPDKTGCISSSSNTAHQTGQGTEGQAGVGGETTGRATNSTATQGESTTTAEHGASNGTAMYGVSRAMDAGYSTREGEHPACSRTPAEAVRATAIPGDSQQAMGVSSRRGWSHSVLATAAQQYMRVRNWLCKWTVECTTWGSTWLLDYLVWYGIMDYLTVFRVSKCGLPPWGWANTGWCLHKQPTFFTFSQTLVPRPRDWPDRIAVTGQLLLSHATKQEGDPKLTAARSLALHKALSLQPGVVDEMLPDTTTLMWSEGDASDEDDELAGVLPTNTRHSRMSADVVCAPGGTPTSGGNRHSVDWGQLRGIAAEPADKRQQLRGIAAEPADKRQQLRGIAAEPADKRQQLRGIAAEPAGSNGGWVGHRQGGRGKRDRHRLAVSFLAAAPAGAADHDQHVTPADGLQHGCQTDILPADNHNGSHAGVHAGPAGSVHSGFDLSFQVNGVEKLPAERTGSPFAEPDLQECEQQSQQQQQPQQQPSKLTVEHEPKLEPHTQQQQRAGQTDQGSDQGSDWLTDLESDLEPVTSEWGRVPSITKGVSYRTGTGSMPQRSATGRPAVTLPPELQQFLDEGDPPVYIGFGSAAVHETPHLAMDILQAAVLTQTRVLVNRSMCVGMDAEWHSILRALQREMQGGESEKVFAQLTIEELQRLVHLVEEMPHDELLPRCCAVVHHGGAGTLHTGLMAGCATFVCPCYGDNFFWGDIVAELGAGPAPVPAHHLTAAHWAKAFEELKKPEYAVAARRLGRQMRAEQGLDAAVAHIYKYLPTPREGVAVIPPKHHHLQPASSAQPPHNWVQQALHKACLRLCRFWY